jgi:hypothetical protein
MNRLVLVVVAVLLALGSGAIPVTGQETAPVGSQSATHCLAPPLASDTPSTGQHTPAAEETAPATADAPGSEAPLPQRTPPPGTPADTAVLERIRIAEENLASCFVAGDSLGFIALLTPKARLTELGLSDPRATPAHSASFLIVREQLLSVTDAQMHADGRVSADIVIAFEGQRMRARDIFVETDGRLLLDEVIALPLESAPAATPVPVDVAMLEALTIMGFPPEEEPSIVMTLGSGIPMQPGDATKLVLGVFDYEVCGTGFRCFVPAAINATWSVTPTDGARLDPTTGVLTIDPGTPSGSIFTVRAAVEGGRHVVETQVTIFTPEANPLIGIWREEAQLACDDGTEVVPAKAIEELIFFADGTFAVTWDPFESYQDYWGTYTFDLSKGTLELTVTGGNIIPPDVDGKGEFAVDASGRLILSDLWLGASRLESGPPNCGHRFAG